MGIKQQLEPLTDGIGKLFVKTSVNPNIITISSLGFAVIAAYLILSSYLVEAAFFAFCAFLFDGLDGIIARARKRATRFGAFLDGVVDRLVEFAILFPMLFIQWPNYIISVSFILLLMGFGTFMTSFTKAYADHKGAITKKDIPKMSCVLERTERTALIFVSIILYVISPLYSMYILGIGAMLSFISFMQRVKYVYDQGA